MEKIVTQEKVAKHRFFCLCEKIHFSKSHLMLFMEILEKHNALDEKMLNYEVFITLFKFLGYHGL